ncbi:MAG TPA: molybdenum cofactor biosynthesis protein MoaE [Desulfohalobiaceae bacterium]|nr:molybdenum cofactor biosynthesis protein MoaE [Desulfohalobiaceae bacterium]
MMDINQALSDLKDHPQFTEKVGMILIHNGVVREWSREDKRGVKQLEVNPDPEKIRTIQRDLENKPGIFKVIVQSSQGVCKPGDDLLYIIVAGDIRENVKPVLSEALERIKTEAINKHEVYIS